MELLSVKQKRHSYYIANREHFRQKHREWYEKNSEQRKQYKLANKDRIRQTQSEWYDKNREKVSDYDLKKRYGISKAEYECILTVQNGVCAGCGNPPTTRKLDVDHNHETNKVRCLLCHTCNKAQGGLKENVSTFCNLLERLIEDKGFRKEDIDTVQNLLARLNSRKHSFST